MLLNLIPEMASLFNKFMLEYVRKAKDYSDNPEKTMEIHTEMVSIYAIKAVQLAVKNLSDIEKEINWDKWLKEHGVGK